MASNGNHNQRRRDPPAESSTPLPPPPPQTIRGEEVQQQTNDLPAFQSLRGHEDTPNDGENANSGQSEEPTFGRAPHEDSGSDLAEDQRHQMEATTSGPQGSPTAQLAAATAGLHDRSDVKEGYENGLSYIEASNKFDVSETAIRRYFAYLRKNDAGALRQRQNNQDKASRSKGRAAQKGGSTG